MPTISPSKLLQMSEARDPVQAIWDNLGKRTLDDFRVPGGLLMVGTYIEPSKTAGGILIPQKSQDECLYQGTTGLLLKKGERAFQDDDLHSFNGFSADVGEWLLFRFSSAWECHINGVSVRFVSDTEIKAVIPDPRLISSRPVAALG